MITIFSLGLLLVAQPEVVSAQWRVSDRRDLIEDAAEIYATIGSQRQHLAVGCDKALSPELRLVFRSGKYLGDERRGLLAGGRDIVFRFDDREPITWRAEYEKNGVIEVQPKQVRRVIDQLRISKRVVIRALNYEYAEIDTIFTYSTPTSVIDDVVQRCASLQGK